MELSSFKSIYTIKLLSCEDVEEIYYLCKSNPQYYNYAKQELTYENIISDINELPQGKSQSDKYYLGFYEKDVLVAIMDLIDKFPDDKTMYISFFMIRKSHQGNGVASTIIKELIQYLKQNEYQFIRLSIILENTEALHFWKKMGFVSINRIVSLGHCYVEVFLLSLQQGK